jgi:hypothetical protein
MCELTSFMFSKPKVKTFYITNRKSSFPEASARKLLASFFGSIMRHMSIPGPVIEAKALVQRNCDCLFS